MMLSSADMGSRAGSFWRSLSWLSRAALIVLLGVVGAMALSLGLWLKDGSPEVQASYGGRPNFGRIGQRPGGFGGQAQGQQGQIPGQQGGAPNRTAPPNRAPAAPAPIDGTVQSIGPGNLFLITPDGTRLVRLGPATQVTLADGSTGGLSDLKEGASVEVTMGRGTFGPATQVHLLNH